MLRRISLLAVLFALAAAAHSQPTPFLNGKVVRITDGDTLWVEVPGQFEWVQVRFYGVDAPESAWPEVWPAQPFSSEGKEFVREQVAGKEVSIRLKDDETYGRAVGEVFIDGKSLSRELLRCGLAWWNKKYEPDDLDLRRLEDAARAAKLGLWSQENPIPPWEHRRRHSGG
jgi:endonuclease YncB( thermonuclease family)